MTLERTVRIAALAPRRPTAGPSAALVFALLAAGCAGDADGLSAAARVAGDSTPPPVIRTPATPYQPTAVVSDGWIGGTVRIAGAVPPDSAVNAARDRAVCGTVVTPLSVRHSGSALIGAVVWLEDIRTGKPLPMQRRYSVGTERCALVPRVQAAMVGGTLNVASGDPVVNQLRITREREQLALVRHTGAGQVVPVESALARPGMIAITSEVHPWTRGYVLVFDHPYFAVTGPRGDYTLENVPPGTYRLVTWHERFGRVERLVEVVVGERTPVDITVGTPAGPTVGPGAEPVEGPAVRAAP